jgi:hypothetical protein
MNLLDSPTPYLTGWFNNALRCGNWTQFDRLSNIIGNVSFQENNPIGYGWKINFECKPINKRFYI